MKYDSTGNKSWQHRYDWDMMRKLILSRLTPRQYIYNRKYYNGTDQDLLIIKYDLDGNTVWIDVNDSGSDDRIRRHPTRRWRQSIFDRSEWNGSDNNF